MPGNDAALTPGMRDKLERAVRAIADHARPELVILFGSYAEGSQTDESDLDLLVVAETEDNIMLTVDLRRLLRPILAPLSFDLLVYTPESWERGRRVLGFVTHDADQRGIRLYEAA